MSTNTVSRHHLFDGHHGGWVPQRPDLNDHEFVPTVGLQSIPLEWAFDLGGIPQLDQARQGSCVGHGVSGVTMCDQKKQGLPIVIPSRAMAYFDARIPEGTTGEDAGASIRDGVKGLVKYGLCPDSEFPYDDQVWDLAPSAQCYADAKKQEGLVYEAVNPPHLNSTLASGFPFIFGFVVYESFMSIGSDGVMPMPGPGEKVIGGHCVYSWGYNARYSGQTGRIPPRHKGCRNSWVQADGTPWGDRGDFYMPQSYFDRGNCSDYWVIRRIGQGK